jgi:hypothetical protein
MSEPTKLMSPALKEATKRLVTCAQQLLQAEKSIKALELDDDTLDRIYVQKTGDAKQAALEFIEVLAEDDEDEG